MLLSVFRTHIYFCILLFWEASMVRNICWLGTTTIVKRVLAMSCASDENQNSHVHEQMKGSPNGLHCSNMHYTKTEQCSLLYQCLWRKVCPPIASIVPRQGRYWCKVTWLWSLEIVLRALVWGGPVDVARDYIRCTWLSHLRMMRNVSQQYGKTRCKMIGIGSESAGWKQRDFLVLLDELPFLYHSGWKRKFHNLWGHRWWS